MSNHYSARIHWSEQDSIFIAFVDELPGCLADGHTPQEALSNLAIIIDEWIEVAKEDGRAIPEPLTLEALERVLHESRSELQAAISSLVEQAQKSDVAAIGRRFHATVGRS